jgi:GTP 3',8-cyclase
VRLVDAFGRPFEGLRISLTDRCNFRCFYCHNEGQGSRVAPPSAPHETEMTADHVLRIGEAARRVGVQKVKLTGGEPLVRPDVESIVEGLHAQGHDVSMTTNGALLGARAASLAEAGLSRVNVSIDSLDPAQFEQIRGGRLSTVLAGVRSALEHGLRPVKLNVVVYRDTKDNIQPLMEYVGRTDGLELQLIQFMPEMAWMRPHVVDLAPLRQWLASQAQRVEERRIHRRKRYLVQGAWVEIVDPVENPAFCMGCHRLRVTADGHVKGCINRNDDLIPTKGLDVEGIEKVFQSAVAGRVPYYGVHVPVTKTTAAPS